jgi:urea transporter
MNQIDTYSDFQFTIYTQFFKLIFYVSLQCQYHFPSITVAIILLTFIKVLLSINFSFLRSNVLASFPVDEGPKTGNVSF